MHKDFNINILEDFQNELDKFQSRVTKGLEEVRQCKAEIQKIKNSLIKEYGEDIQSTNGYVLRNGNRIVLSAPEIIIGNVDNYGVLFNAPSRIVVRGNEVSFEGVGSGGNITTRASSIHSIAEDPGQDGLEHVVQPISEIVSQAKAVSLRTEDVEGVFLSSPHASMQGIELRSETGIGIHAVVSNERKKKDLKYRTEELKERIKDLESDSNNQKKLVQSYLKDLQKLIDTEDLTKDLYTTRTSYIDIDELHETFNSLSVSLYATMGGYFQTLSLLAEANRQKDALEKMEKKVDKKKSSFKEKSTYTSISMYSERIDALSVDGDGNYRENPEAGVNINAKHVSIGTFKADESLHAESTIHLASQKVEVSTINPKMERNDKQEITKGDYPAVGDVIIKSKNIGLETVDYEWKDKKMVEKALTKGGKIALRTETVDVSVTDTEGKATGQVEVNAKAVEVKSMDVDKEKRTDKALAAGSTMLLLSEKMFVGARDSKTKSQQVQVASDKTGVFADTTLELQQAKAVVQLSGGNAAVGGGNLDLYGKTTLQGDVTAKGGITGGDIEMKNMKVKTSFKSPSTSEGIAVPGAPATGKLSAKLKEEELKTKQ